MKLLLGRLFTGKILFLIFSFAVLIFPSVIQSRMFELLSLYARYPEIDTLEDLTESEIFARVPNIEAFSRIMKQWPQYESLKKKLIQDYNFYENIDSGGVTAETGWCWSYEFLEFLSEMSWTSFTKSSSDPNMSSEIMNSSLVRGFLALQTNELAHMNMDAYALSVPGMFLSQENFLFKSQFVPHGIEVHRVKECLVSYPFSYRMPKNSFFLEPLNRKIVQLLESGLVKNRLEIVLTGRYTGDGMDVGAQNFFGVQRYKQAVDDAPRPFTMLDLQIAFISLGVGHLLAFLAFIAELLINYNETAVHRFFTEIQKSTTYFVTAFIMRTLRR
ncbi:unnamed protein product [Bemisia tabaci]|uniref:Ionotropic receptor n=1 Tax=Bemisia tabaci TaxID=7038 RepID=A0A9P0F7S9_BEMTA|nr:unnamed protein product [Bemisia tabaci]